MVWKKNSRELLGINAFGLRLRHECFDKWLRARASVDCVMEHLAEANFDPEFFDRHEDEIVARFQTITA
jgi:hypothetical protein